MSGRCHRPSATWQLRRFALLAPLLAGAFACRESTPSIEPVVREHLARYPLAGLEDIYSALLHGALGPAHGTRDSVAAARWLHAELAALPAGPAEPVAEDLSGDTGVVRVNLRPYLALGGSPDALLAMFLRSGEAVTPRPFRLAHALRELAELAERGDLPWSADSVRRFARHVSARDHEPVGHSAPYLEAYRPAYRVASRAELLRALPDSVHARLFAPVPPSFPTGRFVDDYGATHVIDAGEWRHGSRSRLRILAWHPTGSYLLGVSVAPDSGSANPWARVDWLPLDGAPWEWGYCMIAYNQASAAAAEANTTVRRDTPRTGCNGYPFTRMRRAD